MLDDLRNSAAKSFQEEEEEQKEIEKTAAQKHEVIRLRKQQRDSGPFLGMTAQQRFVVALLLFMMVSVMGVLLLVATEKIFLF
jgi:hypothetical protein